MAIPRRGFRGNADVGRGGRRDLVAARGNVGVRAERLAVSVRTGGCPRGAGTGSGGRGGSARGRVAPGRGGCAFPGGFAEVAARQEPEQAERGHRGDEGGPPRGEGRAVLPGGSGAAGEAPFGSRRRVGQARHDRVVAQGCRPTAQGPDGVRSPEGCGWAAVPGDPSAAQGAGAVAGPDGHDRASPRGTPRVAQGNGAVEQGDRPAGRGGREAGRGGVGVGGLQGHDQIECRTAEGGEGLGEAVQTAGHRERRSSLGAAGVRRPQGAARGPASRRDRLAEQGDRPAALVPCTGLAGAGGHARAAVQTDRSASGGNRAGEGPHRIAAPTQRPTAYRGRGS